MSTELVSQNGKVKFTPSVVPSPSNLEDVQRLAKLMVASGFFKETKDIAQASVKILAGQTLGIPAVQAIMGIHFVNGRLTYEAVILAAAIKNRGYSYRAISHDDNGAKLEFFDKSGASIGVSEFTMQDATTAGLVGKDNWKKYKRNMCFARAMVNGCRWYCPDIFNGPVYTPEEIGAEVDENGRPTDEFIEAEFTAQSEAETPGANFALKFGGIRGLLLSKAEPEHYKTLENHLHQYREQYSCEEQEFIAVRVEQLKAEFAARQDADETTNDKENE